MPDDATTLVAFRMPSLGADMDAGTILQWQVRPGNVVHRGDVVAIVQTDKSDLDLEVFVDGTMAELIVPEGVRVPVGTVLATISAVGAAAHGADAPAPVQAASSLHAAGEPSPAVPTAERPPHELHSPVLRHLADRLHVDATHLAGSGPGGQVTRDDIERAARRPRATPRARRLAALHGIELDGLASTGRITGDAVLAAAQGVTTGALAAPSEGDRMRIAIARQMTKSWQEIPHFRVATRIEVSGLLAQLAGLNERRSVAERVLPAAALLRAAAQAAADVKGVNGWWQDGAFRPAPEVHVGVVVALRSGGLLAPVIRNADQKTLDQVMAELRDLVTRARTGHLRASDVGSATFTVTQLGENEVEDVSPIIHPPQVAILGLGALHHEPWAVDDALAVRPVVHASLAADHRAIDGRIGSLYLNALRRHLQEALP
ncbi:MAG: dihydrolipoamide acetyltransferase family protein [Ilumatobacteraceae bacterium]